jgi:nucleolin
MSKSKTKGSKGAAPVPDVLSRVKNAAVTKPAQTAKAKSKEIAKQLAGKEEKKNKLKKVKEPTPESSDAEPEEESHQSESSEDSDSEVEVEKPIKNGKVNGSTHVISKSANRADSDEDESEAESDESESSEDKAPAAPQSDSDSSEEDSDGSDVGDFIGVKAAESSDEEEEEDDDDEEEDDDDDSDDESDVEKAPAKNKGPVKAEELSKKLSPIAAEISSDEDSKEDIEDGATDSEEDSSDGEEEAKPVQPAKTKRKAEDVTEPVAKKSKTAEAGADESQGGNLFVGNLSWNVDEEWLTREFEEFGELSGVRIITDRNTGRSKG